ncbi:TRAF-like [Sesbania bispinosa]|nr:TRAF-like [Sesbania bispinosa]
METQPTKDKTFEKFTWTVQNFSKLDSEKLYSETFFLGGHQWRILIFPKGNKVNYLSIYLDVGDVANLPEKWSRVTHFKLALINQLLASKTIRKGELHDFSGGFIVNDTCIIEAEISVMKSEPAVAVYSESPKEISTASVGELVDFRGLGKIEKAFVPLLEEVSSCHPSLLDCQQKRSHRFTEWAFKALGLVLHFLKIKKLKDMNEGMKSYTERFEQVKRIKKNVAELDKKRRS